MIKKEPKIVFSKYEDPLSSLPNCHGEPDENVSYEESLNKRTMINDEPYDDGDIFDQMIPLKQVLVTPFGAVPANFMRSVSEDFNFWVGNTNFNIDNNIVDILEGTDGVESLDVFTRYRFRISVGVLFKPADVFASIQTKVKKYFKVRV